jgi:hypothetical protein
MRSVLRAVVALAFFGAACNGTTTPTSTPAPTELGLTGTWTGTLTLEGTTARMTWTLTQTGTSVFGPVLVLLPSGIVLLNGTFAGSLAGSVLTYTITVLAGGIPARPDCTGQLAGTVTVATTAATSALTGNYALTSSTCSSPFSSGNFTLTKQ